MARPVIDDDCQAVRKHDLAGNGRNGSGAAVSATSTDRLVFRRQQPYRCTAANWRLGPQAVSCLDLLGRAAVQSPIDKTLRNLLSTIVWSLTIIIGGR
jgi:hypothetical protein